MMISAVPRIPSFTVFISHRTQAFSRICDEMGSGKGSGVMTNLVVNAFFNDHCLVNMKEQRISSSFLAVSSVVLALTVKVLEVVELLLVLPGLVGGRHPVVWRRGGWLGVPEDSLLRSSSSYLNWIIALHIASASDLRILAHWEPISVNTPSETCKESKHLKPQ